MTKTMTRAAYRTWVGKVAAELGWTVARRGPHQGDYGARITNGELTLHLGEPSTWNRDNKIDITPGYPKTSLSFSEKWGTARGQIGVTAGRDPAAVAADIARRVLPVYRATLAKVTERNTADAAATAQRTALAKRITRQFPRGMATLPETWQTGSSSTVHVSAPGSDGGWLKIYSEAGEVQFDNQFRVPAEVAVKMMAVYGRYIKAQAGKGKTP